MAERDVRQKEVLFSDVAGDAEKVRAILAEWGVEESSIRGLTRGRRADTAGGREAAKPSGREPSSHAGN